jgi:hypothetical protein
MDLVSPSTGSKKESSTALSHLLDFIGQLTCSHRMDPWRVGTNYDRPVPRRILEESGIPRDMFGQKKSATQLAESFEWPYATELQASYTEYLRLLGVKSPIIGARRLWNSLDKNVILPLEERFGLRMLRKFRAVPLKASYCSSGLITSWLSSTQRSSDPAGKNPSRGRW